MSSSSLPISSPSPMSLFLSHYFWTTYPVLILNTLPFFIHPIALFSLPLLTSAPPCSLSNQTSKIQHPPLKMRSCFNNILSSSLYFLKSSLPIHLFLPSFFPCTLTHAFQNPYGHFPYKTGCSKPEHICVLWSLWVLMCNCATQTHMYEFELDKLNDKPWN